MDIEEIMCGGIVFKGGDKPKRNNSKPPKKKMSGAQKMRADYHARVAAKAAAREKRRAERQENKNK